MDRLRVSINGTDYTLPISQFMDPAQVDLSNWDDEVVGDYAMYYAPTIYESDLLNAGGLGLGYGEYIIMLESGMYITLTYEQEREGIPNFVTVLGLYNADGTAFGNLKGLSCDGQEPTIYSIYYKDINDNVYYGICIGDASGPMHGYCQIFLFNEAIWSGNTVDPYTGEPIPPTPGGWGTWDRSSDEVGPSPLPSTILPISSGVNVYRINAAALHNFSQYLWGSNETLWTALWGRYANFRYNPIGAIITAHALPTDFLPTGSATSAIKLAGTSLGPISGSCASVTTQFTEKSWTLQIPEFYGDFMDYTATSVILHMPFIGRIPIDPIYCVGGGITIVYRCDTCTGNIAAMILATNRSGRRECIMTASGNCAYSVPITGHDDGMVEMIGSNASTIIQGVKTAAASVATGKPQGSIGGFKNPLTQKQTTDIVGNMAGSGAIVTNLSLYAEILYSEPSNPDHYTQLRGRPSDIGGTVGDFTGFTIFSDIHADAISGATDEEKREIEQTLQRGVYV